MFNRSSFAVFFLSALFAVSLFAGPEALAQDDPMVPDTIIVTTPDNQARRMFNEGQALLRENDAESALAKFEEGLELDPASSRNMYGKALAHSELEQESEAVEAFEAAIELSQENGDTETLGAAQRALGTIAYRNAVPLLEPFPLPQENAEQVLPLLQQAEAGQLNNPMLPYQFARTYNALGQFEDAEQYAMTAVEVGAEEGEDNSALYYELGLARVGTGDKEGAREAFEQAIGGTWGGWAEYQISQLDAEDGTGG
ncbi:MAG: tetratricopeptide repeat protein [Rubricoccaceae bacterium]|nr:tetratricopeptide repeat protein [Rubricoccaceae bacterium]